eukprot:COSAG06_NODE_1261_length_10074_cov_21.232882_11_plen_44_part_00
MDENPNFTHVHTFEFGTVDRWGKGALWDSVLKRSPKAANGTPP